VLFVMEVNLSAPAMTVSAFVAYAKANPGRIAMAFGGQWNSASVRRTVQGHDRTEARRPHLLTCSAVRFR
jgi:hypothetical protein